MSFFLPSRLVDFEYIQTEEDTEYSEIAKPYSKTIDFAFFAVNFGYSKADYQALTPKERLFIYKAWEQKKVSLTSDIYNAVFTAFYNVQRGKKRALKLFKKKQRKIDKNTLDFNLKTILKVEEKEGKGWLEQVYKANGMRFKRKEESNGA